MNRNSNKLLWVEQLSKCYQNRQAVKDISFSLDEGDIFAFLGPNGAGKTTTLRLLLDIIKADSGIISWNINGKNTRLPSSQEIGYLPEERGLYPELPIIRTLVYIATIRGMDADAARKAAMEWLEKVGLADRAGEKLQALSKGNQQKIQFIASILHKPAFVILDEPFSGLDPINQEQFIEYIKEINRQGTTILLSAHQMPLVERLAKKVFLMNRGEQIFHGELAEIFKTYGHQHILNISFSTEVPEEKLRILTDMQSLVFENSYETKITLKPGANLGQTLSELGKFENITNIKSHQPGLHDIFLQLVKEHQP
ncbi:ABC transporter, ATP-binding protein [Fulvivirga imtechensis AK7]|uniref:ABC transporter, ATP-binding protein n=1 Tax=Fulvivirga imtechensis AK7 TaxID=1237149 RepID=L8K0F6_9BACT|nr:ATP-binding cassette domain-containing protein [Fulvivirga imtechensis]ELR73419.1 ABC transporter, ATP-binding protein [Fulvivirga imtechensis AK7]